MNDIGAIVEGQTEMAFVKEIIAPHLFTKGVSLWARLPGRHERHGGARPWRSVLGEIVRTLNERNNRHCTIMFDYYAMPMDWPGRTEARALPGQYRAAHVEDALAASVAQGMGRGFRGERFIPYVQMYEFEAVLFSDVQVLADLLATLSGAATSKLSNQLGEIVNAAGDPESINDGPETAPSKRILKLVRGYSKSAHGVIAAKRIGLANMRMACPHFNQWVERLEAIHPESADPQ